MTRLRRALARRLRMAAYRVDVHHWTPHTTDSPAFRYGGPVVASRQADLDAWLHNHVTMPAEWMTRDGT